MPIDGRRVADRLLTHVLRGTRLGQDTLTSKSLESGWVACGVHGAAQGSFVDTNQMTPGDHLETDVARGA